MGPGWKVRGNRFRERGKKSTGELDVGVCREGKDEMPHCSRFLKKGEKGKWL